MLQMDIKINFDLNAITGFFKKNKMLVLPVGICIVSIVLLIPEKLIGNSVKSQMETSVRQSKSLSGMIKSDTPYSKDHTGFTRRFSR